jgi:predicted nucleic acid-binding Zn ribbon protein
MTWSTGGLVRITGMDSPATAPQTRVTSVSSQRSGTVACPNERASLKDEHAAAAISRECVVCSQEFSATRATARCCSGRCRIMLSRARRVAELVRRLALAETGLRSADQAIQEAANAIRDLRTLAEQGGPKVAP